MCIIKGYVVITWCIFFTSLKPRTKKIPTIQHFFQLRFKKSDCLMNIRVSLTFRKGSQLAQLSFIIEPRKLIIKSYYQLVKTKQNFDFIGLTSKHLQKHLCKFTERLLAIYTVRNWSRKLLFQTIAHIYSG